MSKAVQYMMPWKKPNFSDQLLLTGTMKCLKLPRLKEISSKNTVFPDWPVSPGICC